MCVHELYMCLTTTMYRTYLHLCLHCVPDTLSSVSVCVCVCGWMQWLHIIQSECELVRPCWRSRVLRIRRAVATATARFSRSHCVGDGRRLPLPSRARPMVAPWPRPGWPMAGGVPPTNTSRSQYATCLQLTRMCVTYLPVCTHTYI